MSRRHMIKVGGNAASVAHRLSEVIANYPFTPSSAMGDFSDEWSAGRTNVCGLVPDVIEMQLEGGAAGSVHGSLRHDGSSGATEGPLSGLHDRFAGAGPSAAAVPSRTRTLMAMSPIQES